MTFMYYFVFRNDQPAYRYNILFRFYYVLYSLYVYSGARVLGCACTWVHVYLGACVLGVIHIKIFYKLYILLNNKN